MQFCIAYGLAIVARDAARVALTATWHWFWRDSISYQASRPAPFSIWGLWGGTGMSLHLPQHLVLGAAVALGLAVAVPATREAQHR